MPRLSKPTSNSEPTGSEQVQVGNLVEQLVFGKSQNYTFFNLVEKWCLCYYIPMETLGDIG